MKKALVFGITGQCGSYLAELLLSKNYEVHGVMRRSATFNTQNIDHIFDKLHLVHGDLTDSLAIFKIINNIKPDEIYNLAAQSHVKVSHELENYTFQVNTIGILNILTSVRSLDLKCKIYHASTSEMYGNITDGKFLLDENSDMKPVSIYGISKLAAFNTCNMYRDAYDMFVVSSILFNHESERRGHTFVTQKIADYVASFIKNSGNIEPLKLGNLNAQRDWGFAPDFMESIYLMMQQEKPDNYVIATGETNSVRNFVELAFKEISIKIIWSGIGANEVGRDLDTGKIIVQIDSKYYRDIDIECLIGNSEKARRVLNWKPKTTFHDLVKCMVKSAIKRKFIEKS